MSLLSKVIEYEKRGEQVDAGKHSCGGELFITSHRPLAGFEHEFVATCNQCGNTKTITRDYTPRSLLTS